MSYEIVSSGTAEKDMFGSFHDKSLLEVLENNCVMKQFGAKKMLAEKNGLTITFHTIDAFADGEILTSEASDPTTTGITAGTKTVTLIQFGGKKQLSDLYSRGAIINMIDQLQVRFGESAARTVDKYIQGTLFGTVSTIASTPIAVTCITGLLTGASVQKTKLALVYLSQTAGVTGSVSEVKTAAAFTALTGSMVNSLSRLTVKKVRYVVSKFQEANVLPYDDSFVCISRPTQINMLRSDPDYVEWARYSNADKMFRGEQTAIEGCRFVTSTNIVDTKNFSKLATASKKTSLSIFLGKNCFAVSEFEGDMGIKSKVVPFSAIDHANALGRIATVGWVYTGAALVLDNKQGLGVVTVDAA
jgi:N4-gp56 family major capsid protein